MYLNKSQLNYFTRVAFSDVLSAQSERRHINPRLESERLRSLMLGYGVFADLLDIMAKEALSQANESGLYAACLPVPAMLKSIELTFNDVANGQRPECLYAHAFQKRMKAELALEPSSASRIQIDKLKSAVSEFCGQSERFSRYESWAHASLDAMDADFIHESLEQLAMEVATDRLSAHYADCAESRAKEMKECDDKKALVSLMESQCSEPAQCDTWRQFIHDNLTALRWDIGQKQGGSTVEVPLQQLIDRVIQYCDVCQEIQQIADKTPGMWHATFAYYQAILMGAFQFDPKVMRQQLPHAYEAAKAEIASRCKNEHLVLSHKMLQKVESRMNEVLNGTLSVQRDQSSDLALGR